LLESWLGILPKEIVMSLKSLLTTVALIAGTSSAAFADPAIVRPVYNGAATAPVYNGAYKAPVVNGAEPCETPAQAGVILPAKLPVIEPMPVVRAPTLLASESRSFRGTETFWVGAWKGRFQTLKLESSGLRSFVSTVKINFADGRSQIVTLNESINASNPCVTIDLAGRAPRAIKSIQFTGANARRSTLKLIAV
jgi:hypothetical protein